MNRALPVWVAVLVLCSVSVLGQSSPPLPDSPGDSRANPHLFSSREPDRVRLSEILISTPQPYDPAQVAEARHKAEELRDAIRRGSVFADIAKANSRDPSASLGGDLGYFKHGALAPSLDELVFRMKVGDVSDVIRAKQGFVILQVTEHEISSGSRVEEVPRAAAVTPPPSEPSSDQNAVDLSKKETSAKPNTSPFKNYAMSPGAQISEAARAASAKRGGGQEGDFGLGTGTPGRPLGSLDILSDTRGVDFDPYLRRIQADVKKNWYRLIPESASKKKGKLAIEFAIAKDGTVVGMKLVASSGDVSLDRPAWVSITNSNPFPPLPSEFSGQYLALRLRFYYNPAKTDLQ